jgi:hypothetical protein
VFSPWIALFDIVARVTVDCEYFHCGLHCLSLLFAKSTVNWRGVMAGLPLPQRVAKIIGGWGCLFIRKKIASSDFSRADQPRL